MKQVLKQNLSWFQNHRDRFQGDLFFDEPLSKHTYYKIGGPASLLIVPQGRADLDLLREGLRSSQTKVAILGAGSNVLVSDLGFEGVVVKTTRLNQEVTLDPVTNTIRVGASVMVFSLLKKAAENGWGGLDFLAGVPGSMGGVVFMNAGTHLGEAKDRLVEATAVSIDPMSAPLVSEKIFSGSHLQFDYRKNKFLTPLDLVFSSVWKMTPEKPLLVKAKIDEILRRRKATQPVDQPSCGSVFKNPRESGLNAWQVIEKLGLRGHRMGGASFSQKHCNFIVNEGGARAADVFGLIQLAKQRAAAELQITLEEEVKIIGEMT